MKNIHLLPTDKPSRLGYLTKKGKEVYKDLRLFDNFMPNISDSENQHIYITSNEEIKLNDYVIQVNFEKTNTQVIRCETKFQVKIANDKNGSFTKNKIILTTDQDLIKEGVQAIDDEFLEWFVNNPSCEEVEVNYQTIGLKNGVWQYHYQIIIPKEEPNPFELQKTLPDDVFYESLEPKQEATLEEAGGIAAGLCQHLEEKEQAMFIAGFIECAKWQSKRIYSEDDMRLSFKAGEVSMNRAILKDEGYDLNSYNLPNVGDFEEWFTNYKKK